MQHSTDVFQGFSTIRLRLSLRGVYPAVTFVAGKRIPRGPPVWPARFGAVDVPRQLPFANPKNTVEFRAAGVCPAPITKGQYGRTVLTWLKLVPSCHCAAQRARADLQLSKEWVCSGFWLVGRGFSGQVAGTVWRPASAVEAARLRVPSAGNKARVSVAQVERVSGPHHSSSERLSPWRFYIFDVRNGGARFE
jgi:hypothetical protein